MLAAKRGPHSTLLNFAVLPFPVSGSNQLSIAETHFAHQTVRNNLLYQRKLLY